MMPKRFLFLSIILILPVFVFSQQQTLTVQGTGNNLYLDHSVKPKESFYSIGRLFNVSPRDLASYNHLSMDNGLNIGQQIKIPLNKDNFTQSTTKSAAEALVAVYHTVASGETLYRIGVNYKNVPLTNLKKWNNLSGDNVSQGAFMVIGFLRVNKSESAFANQNFDVPKTNVTASAKPVQETPKPQPQTTPDNRNTATAEKVNPVPVTPTPVIKTETAKNKKAGVFKSEFDKSTSGTTLQSVSGSAATFKSTSGWQDEKYYCFNNDATPGSVIRITSTVSPNVVYAKVLDAIPDIKQNEGLKLVLSNAAADVLGVDSDKFDATISYVK